MTLKYSLLNIFLLLEPYPAPFLFIMSKDGIKAIDLLTVDTTHVLQSLNYIFPMSMDTDEVEQKLYFKDGTNIARSRLDGTHIEVILRKANPQDMTIDGIRRRIFWTDWNQKKILVANLNEKTRRMLKATKHWPWFIAVDSNVG